MSKLSNLEFFKLVAGNGDAGPAAYRARRSFSRFLGQRMDQWRIVQVAGGLG